MTRRRLRGDWAEVRDQVRKRWDELTEEDLEEIDSRRPRLIGRIEERYGIPRAEAARQVQAWERARKRASGA